MSDYHVHSDEVARVGHLAVWQCTVCGRIDYSGARALGGRVLVIEEPDPCGRTITLGGASDPYEVACDRPEGHVGAHGSHNPLGPDTGAVTWTGGGMCAGDPLPIRNLTFTTEKHWSLP